MLNDLAALYSDHAVLFAGSVFVLGLVIGSFLNVVIYRLPIILEREWRLQATELLPPAAADTMLAGPDVPALYAQRAPLGMPRLQSAHHGLAKYPHRQLVGVAWAMCGV